jgi:hypothetical protein
MIHAIGLVLMIFADRFRGRTGFAPKQVKRVVEAYVISLCLGHWNDPIACWITFLVWVGICIASYGNAIGPAATGSRISRYPGMNGPNDSGPEWWQRGILLTNVWVGLVALGVIWAAPVTIWALITGYKTALIIFPVAMICFPLSCAIGHILQRLDDDIDGWVEQQWSFGITMSGMFAILYPIVT